MSSVVPPEERLTEERLGADTARHFDEVTTREVHTAFETELSGFVHLPHAATSELAKESYITAAAVARRLDAKDKLSALAARVLGAKIEAS